MARPRRSLLTGESALGERARARWQQAVDHSKRVIRREGGSLGRRDLLLGRVETPSEGDAREFRDGAFGLLPGRQPAIACSNTISVALLRLDRAPRREGCSELGCRGIGADGQPGQEACSQRGGLLHRGDLHGTTDRVGQSLTNTALSAMPPSMRSAAMGKPLSDSLASTRSAPRCATPSSTARTISARPEPRVSPTSVPACTEVPHRRPETEQCRHEPDVSCGRALGRHRLGLLRCRDDPEVVAEPFDAGAGGEHDRFGTPGRLAADAERNDGKGARTAPAHPDGPSGGAHALVEHAAGPEGGLGQPGQGAALPDEGCLLVAGDPADGRRSGKRCGDPERS